MGNRYARDNRPQVTPVTKVELSKKNIALRITLVAILIFTAMVFFGIGINALFSANNGWQEIKADADGNGTCGNDFIFQYNLGQSGVDATTEKKRLIGAYSKLCEEAYSVFQNDLSFENVNNLRYINEHPNEEIQVAPFLYEAFSTLEKAGSRALYLAPIYEIYDDVFYCETDEQAAYYDPYQNEEIKAYYNELYVYASDENQVKVELLSNNTIRLFVSEEYLQFAMEEEINTFTDFMWMKNAFIIDYLAEELIKEGYTLGTISSYDGFSKNLTNEEDFSVNLFHKKGEMIYQAGALHSTQRNSMVQLRSYPVNSLDRYRFYTKNTGEVLTPYLSTETGLPQYSFNELVCYSEEYGCAELLLKMQSVYMNPYADEKELKQLEDDKIYSVYMNDTTIYYNEETCEISDLYNMDGIIYQTQKF